MTITHIPTGHVAHAESASKGIHSLAHRAMHILRAKIAAPMRYGPLDIVRCYEVPDGMWSTPLLDGAVHIRK